MNVGELIEELQKLNPAMVVVKQRDDEGNGYQKLYAVDDDAYVLADDFDQHHLEVVTMDDIQDSVDEGWSPEEHIQVCVIV